MVAVVPELGPGAWVTDPMKQLDLLMSHALESDYSQSTIYQGKIFSIPFIIASWQQDEVRLVEEINNGLGNYLGRYFDSTDVNCTVTEVASDGTYALNLAASVKRNGLSYGIERLAEIKDGHIRNVIKEANR